MLEQLKQDMDALQADRDKAQQQVQQWSAQLAEITGAMKYLQAAINRAEMMEAQVSPAPVEDEDPLLDIDVEVEEIE